jgi:MFS family permease
MLFGAALGGMLLSSVLWVQNVWHWSALESGLAILPGPALVPVWAIVAGKLMPRFGPGPVVALGSAAFAAAVVWWAAAMTVHPNYFAGMFGGMCLTGVGVGLAMPTLFGAAASSLPPQRFATGSGVVNMIRQIGLTIGVAVLVALTSTAQQADRLASFQHAWFATAGLALAAGVIGCQLHPVRAPKTAPSTSPAPVVAESR